MFSFFKTKKPSPGSSSPESDPIPSASDFEIVNDPRQGSGDPNPNPTPYPTVYPAMYPSYPHFGQHFGNPAIPPVPPTRPPLQHTDSIHCTNYVHDVPFKLSSELSLGNSDEITRIQVDDILSLITSKMGVTQMDYDFTLERSLLQQHETDTTDATDPDTPSPEEEADEE